MWLFGKNKSDVDEESQNQQIDSPAIMTGESKGEEDSGGEINNANHEENDIQKEDMVKMDTHKQKRIMYIAVDKEGGVLLNNRDNPYFQTVKAGDRPGWPKEIQKVARIDDLLCM